MGNENQHFTDIAVYQEERWPMPLCGRFIYCLNVKITNAFYVLSQKMNFKKVLIGAASGIAMLGAMVVPALAAGGFDANGYNLTARLFNGTLLQWCTKKGIDQAVCPSYGFGSNNDRIVMKWNAEWDRGNAEGWAHPPYNAWTDNEWNGKVSGGSGVVWHYKIVWVGDDPSLVPDGAYGIWGQFAVIMDQGTDPSSGHTSFALGNPAGYGAYFSH